MQLFFGIQIAMGHLYGSCHSRESMNEEISGFYKFAIVKEPLGFFEII